MCAFVYLLGILANIEKAIRVPLCPVEIGHNSGAKPSKKSSFVQNVNTRGPDMKEARKKISKGS